MPTDSLPTQDAETAPEGSSARARPTLRSVLVGAVFVAVLGVVVPWGDLKIRGTWMSSCHLPIGAVVLFLLVVGLANPLLGLLRRRWRLSRAEVVVIYCMMLAGGGVPSFGLTEYLIPTLAGVRYYASAANRWEDTFFRYIPGWFGPTDEAVIRGFFEGLRPGASIPWRPWVGPLLVWTAFALVLFAGYFCLSVLLRRQWVEHEKLIFPLVQLPIQVLGEQEGPSVWRGFFANRGVWFGAAIPLIIHSVNGLHFYHPAIPQVPLAHGLNQYFPAKPWSEMGMLLVILHFSIVGFSYLLSAELSFSLWFFFVFFNLQSVVLYQLGIEVAPIPDYPTRPQPALQMLGGFLVFAVYMGVLLRGRVREMLRATFHTGKAADADEPLPYRTAIIGLVVAMGLLVGWCSVAGMSAVLATVSFLLFSIAALVLTRCVSEGGLLFVQAPFRPTDMIAVTVGSGVMSPQSMTILTFIQRIFMLDLRTFLLPSLLDSYKLGEWARLDLRRLVGPLMLAVPIAALSSYVAVLHIAYRYSGLALEPWFLVHSPQQPWRTLAARLATPVRPSLPGVGFIIVGALATAFLFSMRTRYVWWPFHPMGFAMGPSWPMIQLWFSLFVGWVAKTVIVRYGGARVFERAKPFFMGLVVGEFAAAGVWLVVAHVTGAVGLRFFLF